MVQKVAEVGRKWKSTKKVVEMGRKSLRR